MTLNPGQTLKAEDWNEFIDNLNLLYGIGSGPIGYGNEELPLTEVGDIVLNTQFTTVLSALEEIANFQGTTVLLPSLSDFETGNPILALNQAEDQLDLLYATLDMVDATNLVSTDNILSSTRTSSWSHQIEHGFIVSFNSDDDARHFFNSGGAITISMSGPADANGHYWNNLYEDSGDFVFDRYTYYDLPENDGVWINVHGPFVEPLTENIWRVRARYISGSNENGARGSAIEIRNESVDLYEAGSDLIQGTFTSYVSESRPNGAFEKDSPNYLTIISLNDGA